MRIRRVLSGRFVGSTPAMEASRSAVVEEAGKDRQRVGGSDRPGKVSSRILTTDSMMGFRQCRIRIVTDSAVCKRWGKSWRIKAPSRAIDSRVGSGRGQ